MGIIWFVYHQRNKKKYAPSSLLSRNISSDPSSTIDPERGSSYFGVPLFTYTELEEATNNFDSDKELGDGGFGIVYYGKRPLYIDLVFIAYINEALDEDFFLVMFCE